MERFVIDEQDEDIGSPSSTNSNSSSSSDFLDDATSPSSSSSDNNQHDSKGSDPLYEMSDLMEQLPIKRGLSKHFQGKSQSFTSLSNVMCLDDLVKPLVKHSCRKRLKPCKSYAGGLDHTTKPISPKGCCSRVISKKPSSSSMVKRNHSQLYHNHHHQHHGFLGSSRPPTHQHRSGNLSGQALLFA